MRNLNDVKFKILDMPLNNHADDVSGYGNDGTWSGTEDYTEGPYGRSIADLDGASNITIEQTYNGNNVAIVIDISPDDVTTQQYITVGDNTTYRGIVLGYQSGYVNIYNDGYPTGTAADTQIPTSVGEYAQIIYTSDGTRTQGYKNGELVFDVSGNLNCSGQTIYRVGGVAGVYYDGKVSNLKFFNINVTGDEVKRLYKDSRRNYK